MKAKFQIMIPLVVLMCAIVFSSCNKDKEEKRLSLNKTEITLRSNEKGIIGVSPSAEGCTFRSENKYIAIASDKGEITPITVGSTYINVTNSDKKFNSTCKVTVTPIYNLFTEPYFGFGANKSTVKANEFRTLSKETSTGLAYAGENSNITLAMYVFNTQDRMTSAAVAFPANNMDATVSFLAERYIPIGYEDGYGLFISNDKKMGVGISVYNSSLLIIIYTPVSSTKSSSTAVKQQIKELMDSYLNKQ